MFALSYLLYQARAFVYCNMFGHLCLRCRSMIDLRKGFLLLFELRLSFIQIPAILTCQPAGSLSAETTFGLKSITKKQ